MTDHAGNYVVVVSNPYGVATSQVATLTVYVPVTITSQPVQQVVPFGGTASFSAHANGYPAPSYQWLFNGGSLTGANNSSLVYTNAALAQLKQFAALGGGRGGGADPLSEQQARDMTASIGSGSLIGKAGSTGNAGLS